MGTRETGQLYLALGLPEPAASGLPALTSEVSVAADASEEASGIPDLLRRAGAVVDCLRLPAGDYLVGRRVLVERKASGDFIQSLYDGRLFAQASYLRRFPGPSFLLVEGCPGYCERFWPRSVRAALLTLVVEFRLPVLFTRGAVNTAGVLLELGRRPSPHGERFQPARRGGAAYATRMLRAIPRIGWVSSRRLIERFGSIEALVAADLRLLQEVPGIGPHAAQAVFDALHESAAQK